MKQLLFIGLLCCLGIPVRAQQYLPVARYFGIEDGLPHRQINCILEDKRGFIWVATNGGVARFDGLRFKIFNKADHGLTTDQVHWMLEDPRGYLWLISRVNVGLHTGIGSIDILDPISGRVIPFDRYAKTSLQVPLKDLNTLGIRADGPFQGVSGALVFGTQNPGGWVSWHPTTGWKRVVTTSVPDLQVVTTTPGNGVLGLYQPGIMKDVVVELDAVGNELQRIEGKGNNPFIKLFGEGQTAGKLFALEKLPDERSVVWEIKSGSPPVAVKTPNSFNRRTIFEQLLLLELEEEKLWLTESGISDEKGKMVLDLLALFPSFNKRYIDNCLRDRAGGIWLGTVFGLELIEVRKDRFRRLLFDEKAQNGGGMACRSIVQRGNTLWINTEGPYRGLRGVDLKSGNVFIEQNDSWNYGLAFDAAGNFWSGGFAGKTNQYGGLIKVDPNSGRLLDAITLAKNIALWTIFPATPNRLWIGTQQGLYFVDPHTKQLSQPDCSQFPELKQAAIIYIGRDRSGAVWLCSTSGFYKMSAEGRILERHWSGGTGANFLPYDHFYHFFEDSDGIFWLGTAGGGLLRWDPRVGKHQLLFRNHGLYNGFVYAVYEDAFGHLWLPTDYGIAQFDKKSLAVRRTWLLADGITQNEFNRTSHAQGEDGTLYFGGLNGVTAFHPSAFYGQAATGSTKDSGKNLVVSDLTWLPGDADQLVNGTAELLATGKITMRPSYRYIQIEFALLDYFFPKKTSYSYKIEGLDNEWTRLNEPVLRLASLPAGKHRLKIRAQSADGTWAANELDFELSVLPPVYFRWWFLSLVLLVLSSGGYYFYRFQLHRRLAQREAQRLQQLDAFKSRFFANISHEFRTPLTVILGMTGSLKNRSGNEAELEKAADLIGRNSRQLIHLVNQLLDLSKLESGKLHLTPANGDLAAFMNYQLESFHSLAQSRGIDLQFTTDKPQVDMAFDHDKIQAILANLLSNAIKFTPEGGKVSVSLRTRTDRINTIEFEVTDTGIGIPADKLERIFDRFYQVDGSNTRVGEGTGIGLALVQELVKLMQGDIRVVSTQGMGSTFLVNLPFMPPGDHLPYQFHLPTNDAYKAPELTVVEEPESEDNETWPLLLIVEDNPDVRFYLAECVRGVYRVVTAANGAEGIAKALELVPDIVVSDVMMPEKDGFELCETLKNTEATSHIPIVLLTARADHESRIAGLRRGADDYLAKPFGPAELMVRLENLVRIRRLLQQRYAAMLPMHEPTEDPIVDLEDAFLQKIREVVEAHLSDANFDMPQLERALGMSRSQVFRKVKALTGGSPSVLIRTIRLQKSRELLKDPSRSVAEVAYEVGFSTPAYFSTMFLEAFGKTPTDFRQK